MLENLGVGLTVLLTGIVVVFGVLVLLIGIIKLYSTIVVSVQNGISDKKNKKVKDEVKSSEPVVVPEKPVVAESVESVQPKEDDTSVPGEIVAAIAAAVEVIFGEGTVKIKSIKKSSKRRSVWKSAGVAENTRSF